LEDNLASRIEAGELIPSLTQNIDIGSPLRKVQIDGEKARDSPLKDLNHKSTSAMRKSLESI